MNHWLKRLPLLGAVALTACATLPQGPSYTAMPGSRKSFEQFQVDDVNCRQYATQAIGGTTPTRAANDAAVGSAAAGTVLGAAIGGLLGGRDGAAVGAGMGLFTGAAVGSGNAQAAGLSAQQQYDNTYYQCMYARGHKVPMPASYARSMRQQAPAPAPYVAPPPNAAIPPPNAPPPDAAVPPPNTPPPYQPPR